MVMYVDNKAGCKHPVVLTAHLDPGLSRWQWLVKWFLAPLPPTAGPAIPPAPEPAGSWTGA